MTDFDITRLLELTYQFRDFHRLSLTRHTSCEDLYADYLRAGLRFFDMSTGIISWINDGIYTILAVELDAGGFSAGDRLPLGETYCSVVFQENKTMAVNHVALSDTLSVHPAYIEARLEAYIATPIRVNEEIFGTLNFTSKSARAREFDATDTELIELMAAHIGRFLEQTSIDSERRITLSRMHESKVRFESAFEYAAIGMALVSLEGNWLRVNQAVTLIFGYSEAELLAIDFQTLTHPDDLDADLEFLREMLAGERNTYRMEKRYFHRDGHEIWALLSVSLVRDEKSAPKYFVSQIQDITAQKRVTAELSRRQQELEKLNEKLELLSTTDPLTQLANRRLLDEKLQEEMVRSFRTGDALSLLFVDVDHFKHYNDTYGHPEGDVALRKLAVVLRGVARKSDVAARQGGEEFALLLPNTGEEGCRNVAERLRRTVAGMKDLEAPITISTGGVTLKPGADGKHQPSAEDMIKSADNALYRAKKEGRNRHCQAGSV